MKRNRERERVSNVRLVGNEKELKIEDKVTNDRKNAPSEGGRVLRQPIKCAKRERGAEGKREIQ